MSVTLEQESLTSPVKLLFKSIGKTPLEKNTFLVSRQMVIWQDYLIGPCTKTPNERGLLLWDTRETSIHYFKVFQSHFSHLNLLNSE